MKYFDSHSHLNLSPLKEQQAEIVEILKAEKVGTITIGTDFETSKLAVEIAENNSNIWASVGLHPNDALTSFVLSVLSRAESSEVEWAAYKELARHPKVVAIGECGLDYFRMGNEPPALEASSVAKAMKDETASRRKQKEIFLKQIELAIEIKKPLMIHCRPSKGTQDAYEDVLNILTTYNQQLTTKIKGNMHFFAGNLEVAKKFLDIGFTLSFAGPITFSSDYNEVIKYIPLNMILSETDAPFAAPAPYRGKTNYPQYVEEVVKKIAEIKNLPLEIVQKSLVENAFRAFSLVMGHR